MASGGLRSQVLQWLGDVLPHTSATLSHTWEMTPDNLATLSGIAEVCTGRTADAMVDLEHANALAEEYRAEAEREEALASWAGVTAKALSVSGRGHLEALVGVAIAVEARAPTTTDVLARGFAIAEDVHTADNTMRDLHHAIARLQHELQAVALEQQELDSALQATAAAEASATTESTGLKRRQAELEAMTARHLKNVDSITQSEGRIERVVADAGAMTGTHFTLEDAKHDSIVQLAQDVTAAERALAGVTNECATFHQLPPDMIAASSALDAARDELRALKEELHAALERGASVA